MRHIPPKPECSHVDKTNLPKAHCDNCGSALVLKVVKPYSKYCYRTGKRLGAVKLTCPVLERSWLQQFISGWRFNGHTETYCYTELHAADLTKVEVA